MPKNKKKKSKGRLLEIGDYVHDVIPEMLTPEVIQTIEEFKTLHPSGEIRVCTATEMISMFILLHSAASEAFAGVYAPNLFAKMVAAKATQMALMTKGRLADVGVPLKEIEELIGGVEEMLIEVHS